MAVDPYGKLDVTNSNANQILRYSLGAAGLTFDSVLSSNTLQQPTGVAVNSSKFLVTNAGTGTVSLFDLRTGTPLGIFTRVPLVTPSAIAFNPNGDVIVSDLSNNSLLMFNGTTGSFIRALVPSGFGGLSAPDGLVYGPDGNLFVSSSLTNRITEYNGNTGAIIQSFSTPGLQSPSGLAFGPDSNLYVASAGNNQILEFNGINGNFMKVFATGNGLNDPTGLAFFTPAVAPVPEPALALPVAATIFVLLLVARRLTIARRIKNLA